MEGNRVEARFGERELVESSLVVRVEMSSGWMFCQVARSTVSTCPLRTTVLTMSGEVAVSTSRTVRTAAWAITGL